MTKNRVRIILKTEDRKIKPEKVLGIFTRATMNGRRRAKDSLRRKK